MVFKIRRESLDSGRSTGAERERIKEKRRKRRSQKKGEEMAIREEGEQADHRARKGHANIKGTLETDRDPIAGYPDG